MERKPPRGVTPHNLWKMNILTDRMNDIARATKEYNHAGKKYPEEWIDEWNELRKEREALESETAGGCSLITIYGEPGEENGKCVGFRKSDENDEPTEKCMECKKIYFMKVINNG